MNAKILVVSRDENRRNKIARALEDLPFIRTVLETPDRLWGQLNGGDIDLVLIDQGSLTPQPGTVVRAIRKLPERPDVVALVDREDADVRAGLLAAGCMAVLYTGLSDRTLKMTLEALIQRLRGDGHRHIYAEERSKQNRLGDFLSDSPAMQQFLVLAGRVVHSDSSLLLLGETGVGKERLAGAIHNEGRRGSGPFVCVNCAALPETLLESELFGHEKGAFTGASRTRRGYFELANGGTIFLDEIAELPPHLQVKLLRVLEERAIQRLGGESTIRIDARLMAATNRDLDAEVAAGRFRADLYYRLAVVTLKLPPLRERREDISGLLDSYLAHFSIIFGGPTRTLTPRAREALVQYAWPGNVRELINVIERTTLVTPGSEIDVMDLPSIIQGPGRDFPADGHRFPTSPAARASRQSGLPLLEAREQVLAEFYCSYLDELLREFHGRVGDSARAAGISERTLYSLMRRYGLRKETYRRLDADKGGA